jgi:hypothetical protein
VDDDIVTLTEAIVMERMQMEINRMRSVLQAIDDLHQPMRYEDEGDDDDGICAECGLYWPCDTSSLLYPEEARRG